MVRHVTAPVFLYSKINSTIKIHSNLYPVIPFYIIFLIIKKEMLSWREKN